MTIQKDGLEISVSNYDPKERQVKRELRDGKLTYINKVTLPTDSSNSVQGDQFTDNAGAISGNKGTENIPNNQENSEKFSLDKDSGKDAISQIVDEATRRRTMPTPADEKRKEQQLDIITKSNPMDESLGEHTWIKKKEDIKTFAEAIKARGEEDVTPDFTAAMAKKALETGKVTVYSSKPIKQCAFVTPSEMEAKDYAGGGKVYKKTVPVEDVAWIDATEGQYAKVEVEPKFALQTIPNDVLIRDKKIDGYRMIKEGKAMRLAEVISQDRGSEKKEDRAGIILKNVSAEDRKQLSINISAISNGTVADMQKRANVVANMESISITPKEVTPSYFKAIHGENDTVTIEDDGMIVGFSKVGREKVFVASNVNRFGVANNFDRILASAKFIYSQSGTEYEDTHVDGTPHKNRDNVYEYRNYLNKINVEGEGEYYVRFTVMRSQDGSTSSHGVKVTDVELIKIPSQSSLSFLRGRQAIATTEKDIDSQSSLSFLRGRQAIATTENNSDAKLQNFFEFANNQEAISSKPEHILPFIGENGQISTSDGKIYEDQIYQQTKQEAAIHSKNFKNWFGDWQKDPENASKVVDKEGKPLVV